MTLDAGAIIGLVSLVVTLLVTTFGAGVAIGKHKEKIERLTRELEDQEHKNDRR